MLYSIQKNLLSPKLKKNIIPGKSLVEFLASLNDPNLNLKVILFLDIKYIKSNTIYVLATLLWDYNGTECDIIKSELKITWFGSAPESASY